MLPVPDALEPLLHKFSVVTAVYGFLLRQHNALLGLWLLALTAIIVASLRLG